MKFKMPKKVLQLIQKFQENGFEIYIVGGAVRDLLLQRKFNDWDFTTNATPEQVLKLFPKNSFYGNEFGTVGVIVGKGKRKEVYEITTFRKEFGYSDKRHPDKITWGKTIEEDLSRRDFTINAMAMKIRDINLLKGKYKYEIIDLFEGKSDLKNKVIRAVGDPEDRLNEDALRMLRAIRLASQLGFLIEEKTLQAIKKKAPLIKKVANERIRDELIKILASNYPADGFLLLMNSGLLEIILPEAAKGKGVAQARHHRWDVWTHSLYALKYCPSKDPIVRLATFLHDVGKPLVAKGKGEERTFYNHEVVGAKIASRIAKRLRLSKKQAKKLVTLIRWHQFTVDEKQTDKALRRFIRRVGKENLKDILDLRVGDRLGGGARETSWRLELFKKRLAEVQKQPFEIKDLKVDGRDVMKTLNISPGPMVGKILRALFAEVEEDQNLNTRKYLLSRIPEVAKKYGAKPTSKLK
jgi:putative nucleotidyltransferase with HDIG domain